MKRFRIIARIRTPDSSTLSFLLIPIASKVHDGRSTIIRILGVPVIRVIRDGFEVRTKFLGLTVGIRPNWQSIDETVSRFSATIADRLADLENRISPEQKKLEKELEKIKMYNCIKNVQSGMLRIEDELELVGKIASKWESDDD